MKIEKKTFVHMELTDQKLDPIKKFVEESMNKHKEEILYYAKRAIEKQQEDPAEDLSFYDNKVRDHARDLKVIEILHDAIRWAPKGDYKAVSSYELQDLKKKATNWDITQEAEKEAKERENGSINLKTL